MLCRRWTSSKSSWILRNQSLRKRRSQPSNNLLWWLSSPPTCKKTPKATNNRILIRMRIRTRYTRRRKPSKLVIHVSQTKIGKVNRDQTSIESVRVWTVTIHPRKRRHRCNSSCPMKLSQIIRCRRISKNRVAQYYLLAPIVSNIPPLIVWDSTQKWTMGRSPHS